MTQESQREAAARKGESIYLGNACQRGHDGRRYTRSGACVTCMAQRKERERKRIAGLLEAAGDRS